MERNWLSTFYTLEQMEMDYDEDLEEMVEYVPLPAELQVEILKYLQRARHPPVFLVMSESDGEFENHEKDVCGVYTSLEEALKGYSLFDKNNPDEGEGYSTAHVYIVETQVNELISKKNLPRLYESMGGGQYIRYYRKKPYNGGVFYYSGNLEELRAKGKIRNGVGEVIFKYDCTLSL